MFERAPRSGLQGRPLVKVGVGLAMGVAKAVFGVVTALVLTLYFLAAYRGIKSAAYRLVPNSRRARVTLLTDEILAGLRDTAVTRIFVAPTIDPTSGDVFGTILRRAAVQ